MYIKSASAKLKYLFAVLIFLLAANSAFAQDSQPFSINVSPLPAPNGFVNDYAGVIDATTKQQLEQKIQAFKDKTNPQVELAVAIVKTTGERPIFDYSLAVARGWKIGSQEDDNPSALLFIAIDDRKYFTQISKDLEDELPDGLAGQLQRQHLVPAFRQQNYGKGISDTIDAYISTIEAKQNGEPVPATGQTGTEKEKKGGASIGGILCCLGVGFILLIVISSSLGKSKNKDDNDRWGGGGFGGGALPWIVGSIIANSGNSSGSSSDWGGNSGGGGSDWGGFGGGGDFGGGGAGGDW